MKAKLAEAAQRHDIDRTTQSHSQRPNTTGQSLFQPKTPPVQRQTSGDCLRGTRQISPFEAENTDLRPLGESLKNAAG
jgi:hypothetical protein